MFDTHIGIPFQSTPPARGATEYAPTENYDRYISIHAPREGGDPPLPRIVPRKKDFNPRPPRGGRLVSILLFPMFHVFQSTPPARGATRGYD